MSGLESIALAVAHLEEKRREAASAAADSSSSASSSSEEQRGALNKITALSPPSPQSFGVSKTLRVVSSDSISSYKAPPKTSANPVPASSPTPSYAVILADPSAWLQAFASAPALSAPPPTEIISQTSENDVLCGRGGETNHHQGNIHYRNLVKAFQPLYIASKRRDKPKIAQCIVYTVRKQGGRFLKRTDPRSSTWSDVGNTKAREKTSQALREGAPELKEKHQPGGDGPPTVGVPTPSMLAHVPPAGIMGVPSMSAFHHHHRHASSHPHQQLMATHPAHVAAAMTPLQHAMSRTFFAAPAGLPVVSPASSFFSVEHKRPHFGVVVSDGDASDGSIANSGGPRLKRLKLRYEGTS